jgi:hypothetical protein
MSSLAVYDLLTSALGSGSIKIAGIDDIEYRARFLVKSHMKTKLADSPIFGVCL